MNSIFDLLKFLHIMSFVFMTVPLFNLIVVNERALFGPVFHYFADRYMENIIARGAYRCFVFQATVFVTGVLLLVFGPLGIEALWTNWIILAKTILLMLLVGSLSYVHFTLQPKIEGLIASVKPDSAVPDNLMSDLKPLRVRRKRMASFCLFGVITIIILGLQVYAVFNPFLTIVLIVLAGLFSWRTYSVLNRFGWF